MVDDSAKLDISEFRCTEASRAGVTILFTQTGRTYRYRWNRNELAIASPVIDGDCGLHAPEIIDCLARAVAYRESTKIPQMGGGRHRSRFEALRPSLFSKAQKADGLALCA